MTLTTIELLRLAHVVLTVVAVGTNVSFPVWVRLAEREPSHLTFTLRAVRRIDRWVTIPAYGLVALTGLALAVAQATPLTSPWLGGSLALFVLVIAVGAVLYAPVSRWRLAAAERGGVTDPAYRRERGRIDGLDALILLAIFAIVALMVLRP